MTHKRFVKLLMSYGYSRNTAQITAIWAISNYGSYQKAFDSEYKLLVSVPKLDLGDLSRAVTALADTVQKVIAATCVGLEAFSNAFKTALTVDGCSGFPAGTCLCCGGTGVIKKMQSLAQIGGPSLRGSDAVECCPACFGTGREMTWI